MQLMSGKVVNGKVEVEGLDLPEGTRVAVLLRDDEETFEIDPDLEPELRAAIEEADRGEGVDADEVLERLRAKQ